MELRKKIRAKDFAMTHCTPSALMISGACSLEDPHPKFFPATIMSPFWICPASSGRRGLNPYCFISSMVFSARYSVGIMISVSISSPSTHTFPVNASICISPVYSVPYHQANVFCLPCYKNPRRNGSSSDNF